jgi:hypothetical protein
MSGIDFSKHVDISEFTHIFKLIAVHADVSGNSALANATADALGDNTATETLTQTTAVQGVGSSSASESLSATTGSHHHVW